MTSPQDGFGISEHDTMIYSCVIFAGIIQIINLFGIVTNVINIICFTKQGFHDSVNISLLGLAVSDLGSLLSMVWNCISLTLAVLAADMSFDPVDVMYLTSAMPHFSFTRVSSCITAMISLERCLCVTSPLKIKSLITSRRTGVITVCVFIIFFFMSAPVYAVNRLGTTFSALRNKTLIGLISTKDRGTVESISFVTSNFLIPVGAFVIIVVCTGVITFELKIKTTWRQKKTSGKKDDRVSTRNQRVAQMSVMISTLFIVCFVPVNIMMLAVAFLPDLSIHGKYMNISLTIAGLIHILECINSSMNIFIYHRMSSRYRETFRKLFGSDRTVNGS